LLYCGGFPRRPTPPARFGAQRAIFAVQRELERIAIEERRSAIVLCDRGTLDGLAYWPNGEAAFFEEMRTTMERELRRYAMVIHLRTPTENGGYVRTNPLRIESATEARLIDEGLIVAWGGHPRRVEVPAMDDFIAKIDRVVELIRRECPRCCQIPPRIEEKTGPSGLRRESRFTKPARP
jgi:hypothetical protein